MPLLTRCEKRTAPSLQEKREWVCGPAHCSPGSFQEALAGSLTLVSLSGCLLSQAMAAQLVVVLLALTSLGAASELDCKELVKPLVLDSHSPIYGKWVLHVGSWDQPGLKSDLVSVNSSWLELSASSDSRVITLYWADRLNDKCLQGLANVTISGIPTHFTFNIHGHTSYHDGKFYETCADCLLSEDTTLLPDGQSKGRYLYLFTRTGALEPSELETFKKQAECLKFLPEYYFVGTDLCPDDRKAASPDVEDAENSETDTQPTAK
uniref:Apolipoprotein M n=1 Tax=Monopterus albus TaxID=43700 RepID=A0A3Q3JB33_MONAL|nr:uncharacterized protein LOC109956854 [Monopterus albus]